MHRKSRMPPNPISLTDCFLNSLNLDTTMCTDLGEHRFVIANEDTPSSSLKCCSSNHARDAKHLVWLDLRGQGAGGLAQRNNRSRRQSGELPWRPRVAYRVGPGSMASARRR
jgi:hypothetical protein